MQANAFAFCEFSLLELQLGREIEQPHLALLLGEDFIEKGEMIAEEEHRTRIVDGRIFPDELIEEYGSHRSHVFVAEPKISASKARIGGLDARNTDAWICGTLLSRTNVGISSYVSIGRSNHVSGKNLFR